MSAFTLIPHHHEPLESILLTGISNDNTRRAYARSLTKFLNWHSAQSRGEISPCKNFIAEQGARCIRGCSKAAAKENH